MYEVLSKLDVGGKYDMEWRIGELVEGETGGSDTHPGHPIEYVPEPRGSIACARTRLDPYYKIMRPVRQNLRDGPDDVLGR